jgi:phage terminase large subunit GpA-like protein
MLTPIHIPRTAPWLPPSLLADPGEIRLVGRFSVPERKIFRKHKKIPVSQWAEQYRNVTTSVLPGKWKNEVTPYLAGIMDASFHLSVRTVIVCAGPQCGKTESVLNCIGYAIDRDPGPVLCIYPDELTARENNQDRWQPMIKTSPRLRGYMTGLDDDSSLLKISLQHMPIYMAWASSAARLANKPIRYLVFDEVDKYHTTAGKRETNPILLGEARAITYRHNCKIWKISTPTTEAGNIWKALTTEAQVIFDYWVACPACNVMQKMTFGQVKWKHKEEPGADGKAHSEDPETIEAEKLAWYECPHCLAQWNDYDRDQAVRHGRWRERKKSEPDDKNASAEPGLDISDYLKLKNPVKIGFHLPSWLSLFISLSKIAASFLRGLSDISEFKDFHNKYLAEPWKLTVISKNSGQILAARCDLPPQTVPEAAVALTVGVDVQQFGFWFVVRAWAPDLTSWLIHYGFLAVWEDVERLLFETSYPVQMGTELKSVPISPRSMRIFRAAVDTGGGKKYEDMTMTEETYFWLVKNRSRGGVALWGTKGSSSAQPGMLSVGSGIVATPSGKKLPEALRILIVDTEKAKDQYHFRLKLAANDDTRGLPGAAFLHADTGSDYVGQILAEEKQLDEKGRESWVNVHQRPNHLFDAEVLCAACVEMEFPGGGLRLIADMAQKQKSVAVKRSQMISKGVE